MEDATYQARSCNRCGNALTADAPEGLCPSCLFVAATETLTGASRDDTPTMSDVTHGGGAADADGQRLAPGQTWGAYRIGRLLGKGGMGEVYEAEHLANGRRLALKVLRGALRNAHDRAQFLREGQLAAAISHPHTVYIYGSEEIAGMPVITMELLPGGTLKDKLTVQGPFSPSEAVAAILDIIGGLDAAQTAGILHRDIKPSNCFVDHDGSVKVGDFGLSISTLARDVQATIGTGFQGTPQFAPPEQLRGDPLDVRADIYAVGATLYYLLTGRPPIEGRDLQDLFARVTRETPTSPSKARPGVPSGLSALVLRCLAKTPGERPASYAALAESLRPFAVQQSAPATLGLRFVAGLIDTALMTVVLGVVINYDVDIPTRAMSRTGDNPWLFLITLVYFLIFEGIWGASIGKRLLRLRVTPLPGRPRTAIVWRTALYHAPQLVVTLLVVAVAASGGTPRPIESLRPLIVFPMTALMFAWARRRNGWSGVHDLWTGTRVVSAVTIRVDRLGAVALQKPVTLPPLATATRVGPFVVVDEVGPTSDGRLLVAIDPVLRRQVWIHRVPADTPAISAARRDVGRAGRLHWLTSRRSADEHWDAYEAPDGAPLLENRTDAREWPMLLRWLLAIHDELVSAARDESTPALALDRIWIRPGGRPVLLDFAPPAALAQTLAEAHTPRSPIGLLGSVAAYSRSVGSDQPDAPLPMPLGARGIFDTWSADDPAPLSLDEASAALVELSARPDRVGRGRRAIPMALAAVPSLMMVIATLLVVPAIFTMMSPEATETLQWLSALRRQPPRPGSRLVDPAIRDAEERYLVGKFERQLEDERFWGTLGNEGDLLAQRKLAGEILARHPSVSPEELAEVSAILAPERQQMAQAVEGSRRNIADTRGIILRTLLMLALALVGALSLISSALIPGGVVFRMLGIAVVGRDGREISRWRSVARAMLAWSPMLLWAAYLLASPKVQGWVPNPSAAVASISLALGALLAGAVLTLMRRRGPHDWATSTQVIPR